MSRSEKNIMIKRMNEYSSRFFRLLLCLMLLDMQLIEVAFPVFAADEQSGIAKLDQAEEKYYDGDPRQSIILVQRCLEDSLLSKDTCLRAYKILARSHLALEEFDLAKENMLLLLELDPAYQPTLEEESPRFVALVDESRAEYARSKAERAQQKTGIKSWIWMGAGGVVVAAIMVMVATASGSEGNHTANNPLPAPPPLP